MATTNLNDLLSREDRDVVDAELERLLKLAISQRQLDCIPPALIALMQWRGFEDAVEADDEEKLQRKLYLERLQLQRIHLERDIWRCYASAALSHGRVSSDAAKLADRMLGEERERFGPLPK